jgi:hypothetical protein
MVNFVNKALTTCPSPKNRKLIIKRFLSSPKIMDDTLEYVLPTKLAIAQREVLARMHRSLEEIKLASFSAKLASKHYILEVIINVRPTSSLRDIARVLVCTLGTYLVQCKGTHN